MRKKAPTPVPMLAPAETAEAPLLPGAVAEIKDARAHVYPLQIPSERNLLLVSAQSSDVVGLALEGQSNDAAQGWVNLGTSMARTPYLALPLGADSQPYKAYRLRAWSADRRSLQMRIRVAAATLPAVSESLWLQGTAAPAKVDEVLSTLRVAMIALSGPGTFRIKGDLSHLRWSDGASRAAQAAGSAVISVRGKTLWLVNDEAAPAAAAFVAERLKLPNGEPETLRLELMSGQTGAVDLRPQSNGMSLVLAQSRAGQPGLALGERDGPPNLRAMGIAQGEAIAIALPGTNPSARVWNAGNQGATLELDLRQVILQQGASQSAGFGIIDGNIKSKTALPVRLSGNPQSVRLTLAPMHAAAFLKHGAIVSTHWSGSDALQETVFTEADQMWLLNAGLTDAQYSVEIAPGSAAAERGLKPGELFERNLGTAGRLRIPVELPVELPAAQPNVNLPNFKLPNFKLRIRGNAQAIWMEQGGRIASGADIEIRGNGVLSLQHQPGTLVAWLDAQDAGSLADWFPALQATAIKPPQTIELRGKEQLFELRLEQASMLHLRTSVPVVTQYVVEGQTAQTDAHLFGANINLLAPAGSSRLMLHAVGAESLSGAATLLMTPVTVLVDGPGPEILLAPGSARLFSFDVRQRNAIGIGIRASSDVVRGVLYDERGVPQSEGVVQMPTLAPGRYYLLVAMPADTAPVRVRPILLGLKPADTRPPYDILKRYVESKDGDPILYVPPPPAPPSDFIPQNEAAAAAESAPAAEGEEETKPSDEPERENDEERK